MVARKRDAFPQGTLSRKTFELLQEARKNASLPVLADQCGVPYLWLRQYADGTYNAPSVDRIQAVYEGLTGTKLLDV